MAVHSDRFPPIPTLDTLPFMRSDLEKFMSTRAEQMDHITSLMVGVLSELPDFADVPEDAKLYLARRVASYSEGLFEHGYQGGMEDGREDRAAEIREAQAFKMRVVGNNN